MPKRWNIDHQHAVLDADTAVAPGASHNFTDEQIEAGLTGLWSDEDPRAGLKAEKAFKQKRDANVSVATDNPDPAESGESKE